MAAAGASQVTIAQKTWEMSNNIMEVRQSLPSRLNILAFVENHSRTFVILPGFL